MNEPGVAIVKIDCDAHKAKCSQFDVSGYPTLKWFPKDNKKGLPYASHSLRVLLLTPLHLCNILAGTKRDVPSKTSSSS